MRNDYKETTYDGLVALSLAGHLVVGHKYLIADYQTLYLMPDTTDRNDTNKTISVERLIVTAISTTAISPVAYSLDYPDDIIHYTMDSSWLGTLEDVGSKGIITYRKSGNLECNGDFRNIVNRVHHYDFSTLLNDPSENDVPLLPISSIQTGCSSSNDNMLTLTSNGNSSDLRIVFDSLTPETYVVGATKIPSYSNKTTFVFSNVATIHELVGDWSGCNESVFWGGHVRTKERHDGWRNLHYTLNRTNHTTWRAFEVGVSGAVTIRNLSAGVLGKLDGEFRRSTFLPTTTDITLRGCFAFKGTCYSVHVVSYDEYWQKSQPDTLNSVVNTYINGYREPNGSRIYKVSIENVHNRWTGNKIQIGTYMGDNFHKGYNPLSGHNSVRRAVAGVVSGTLNMPNTYQYNYCGILEIPDTSVIHSINRLPYFSSDLTLEALGGLTIDTGGNIEITTPIVLTAGQSVTLKEYEEDKWKVISVI